MTKEQWQSLYNELYTLRKQFNQCYYDVFENTDISDSYSNKRKIEMKNLMSSGYYKISGNQEALKLFEKDKNIKDLKYPDHFEYNLTPFLHDIEKHIQDLS